MIITDLKIFLNEDSLKEIYLYANTPLYLYNRFRDNSSIKNIAERYSTEELLRVFYTIMPEKKNFRVNFLKAVQLYSLIMGLSLKPYKEVVKFFKSLPDYNIEWAKELNDIYFSFILPETRISIRQENKMSEYLLRKKDKNFNPINRKKLIMER